MEFLARGMEIEMPTATLTSKGQITLPLAVRVALGITAGQKMDVYVEGDNFRVVAVRSDVSELRGRFAGRVKMLVSIAERDAAIAAGAFGRMRCRSWIRMCWCVTLSRMTVSRLPSL
jgi:antitoxin PrlF